MPLPSHGSRLLPSPRGSHLHHRHSHLPNHHLPWHHLGHGEDDGQPTKHRHQQSIQVVASSCDDEILFLLQVSRLPAGCPQQAWVDLPLRLPLLPHCLPPPNACCNPSPRLKAASVKGLAFHESWQVVGSLLSLRSSWHLHHHHLHNCHRNHLHHDGHCRITTGCLWHACRAITITLSSS